MLADWKGWHTPSSLLITVTLAAICELMCEEEGGEPFPLSVLNCSVVQHEHQYEKVHFAV